jgi:hypothetical protein
MVPHVMHCQSNGPCMLGGLLKKAASRSPMKREKSKGSCEAALFFYSFSLFPFLFFRSCCATFEKSMRTDPKLLSSTKLGQICSCNFSTFSLGLCVPGFVRVFPP